MSGARSSHIHRLRQCAPTVFDSHGEFKQEYFATQFDRNSIPAFQRLLGVTTTGGGKKYALFPPILFQNVQKKERLFLNSAVVNVWVFSVNGFDSILTYTQVLKVILFGPTSLTSKSKKPSGRKPFAVKHRLTEVTPGMIAFASIIVSMFPLHVSQTLFDTDVQVRFLLSPDEDFSTKGSHTGVSYVESFKMYKDLLIDDKNKPLFEPILSELNSLLFSARGAVPRKTAIDDQGDYEDEVQEFLRGNLVPPPTEEGATTDDIDSETPDSPAGFGTIDIDLEEEPRLPHHAATSIILEDSHTTKVSESSRAISITMLPSGPEAEVDPPVVRSNKGRPAPKKRATNTNGVGTSDTTNATPAPTTRGTRASTRQAATLPEQDSNPAARSSVRKRGKRS